MDNGAPAGSRIIASQSVSRVGQTWVEACQKVINTYLYRNEALGKPRVGAVRDMHQIRQKTHIRTHAHTHARTYTHLCQCQVRSGQDAENGVPTRKSKRNAAGMHAWGKPTG